MADGSPSPTDGRSADADAAAAIDAPADQGSDLPPCQAGRPVQGGFYISCGPHPMIMMPPGCSASTDEPTCGGTPDLALVSWGASLRRTTTSESDGAQNSVDLGVFAAASPGAHPAAEYCLNLRLAGYHDWYLPSSDQLRLATQNSASVGISGQYWSSTESGTDNARSVSDTGATEDTPKSEALLVRCVRQHGLALPRPSVGVPPTDSGYFVLTARTFTGDLGGVAGATIACVDDLAANEWMGKTDASARGLIVREKVRPFLCTSGTSCFTALPSVRYFFARSGAVDVGGASFVADALGRGPGNQQSPSATNYFGIVSEFWTGRGGSSHPELWSVVGDGRGSDYCANWTATAGTAIAGDSTFTEQRRWSNRSARCDERLRLLCLVHP